MKRLSKTLKIKQNLHLDCINELKKKPCDYSPAAFLSIDRPKKIAPNMVEFGAWHCVMHFAIGIKFEHTEFVVVVKCIEYRYTHFVICCIYVCVTLSYLLLFHKNCFFQFASTQIQATICTSQTQ